MGIHAFIIFPPLLTDGAEVNGLTVVKRRISQVVFVDFMSKTDVARVQVSVDL